MILFPPSYWTDDELKDIPTSDLSCEIADTVIINTPEAEEYLNRLIKEIQNRYDT